ncbi:MAG: outer membrane protein assembly factor BamD [Verrucomicrobiota bacterium]
MTRYILILILFIGFLVESSDAALVWRPGEGWVNESSGETLAASDAKEALQIARNLETKEAWDDAAAAYKSIVRSWPLSSAAGEAQFKAGYMKERMGDFWAAYKAYQKVVEKYSTNQFFNLAIERQYNIGNLYLAGEPQRLWKIPLLPSMEKTVEIFETVVKNAPYGTYAAPSHFKIGLARENQGSYSKAISSYTQLLDRYPGSDLADDAQYQIGYAWFRASSLPDYDQSAAEKAIEAFQDFLVKYPNSEKVAQAEEYVGKLTSRKVEGSFNIAKFYEKQKNFKAALIYYREVVREGPETEFAELATERIDALDPTARSQDENNNSDPSPESVETASTS